MRWLTLWFLLLLTACHLSPVCASPTMDLPPGAKLYAPLLKNQLIDAWPDLMTRSYIAAQVEQESCISLKSKGCWNPNTELKTDREYGFGLGQITVTKKFNVFEELKKTDPQLKSWQWADRFNPKYQLRAIVVMDRNLAKKITWARNEPDRIAFAMSSYNGGLGGVLTDRRLCANTPGCDPDKWFDNVEKTSLKSRTRVKGYGQSFFDVNRGYVKNVISLQPRRAKYIQIMD